MKELPVEFRPLGAGWEAPLADFFQAIRDAGDDAFFHPHALTPQEARKRCEYEGRDVYYICTEGRAVLGYGMLRGWDDGYDVPSLGIAVHPSARGRGLAKALVYILHAVARRRRADKIRVTVYPNNRDAVRLYEQVGYRIVGQENGRYIALCHLSQASDT